MEPLENLKDQVSILGFYSNPIVLYRELPHLMMYLFILLTAYPLLLQNVEGYPTGRMKRQTLCCLCLLRFLCFLMFKIVHRLIECDM